MEAECVAKKWGSSLGVIIPREIVRQEHIMLDESLRVNFKKQVFARTLWNLGPIRLKKSAQQIKDELRKGW